MIDRRQMLKVAYRLESMANDAYMDCVSVRMTPKEVHALAMDLESFARNAGCSTCYNTSALKNVFECGKCGFRTNLMYKIGNEYYKISDTSLLLRYCPSCGAAVIGAVK